MNENKNLCKLQEENKRKEKRNELKNSRKKPNIRINGNSCVRITTSLRGKTSQGHSGEILP